MTDPIAIALSRDLSRILGQNVRSIDVASTAEAIRAVPIVTVARTEHSPTLRALLDALKAHRQTLARSRESPDDEDLWRACDGPREAYYVARDAWERDGFKE